MISVKDITKAYGAEEILRAASLEVGNGQKVALVGANGVGKSTLLQVIAGIEEPDKGTVSTPSNALLGYMPQEIHVESDLTVREYLGEVSGVDRVQLKLRAKENELAGAHNSEELLAEYGLLQDQFDSLGGYDFETKLDLVLAGLGLDDIQSSRSISSLSGGQKSKVGLAGVLLKGVDILLFDEPTNNLDLPAIIWLEDYLKRSSATIIIVSHDRKLLDRTVSKVFEIDWFSRSVAEYGGSYSDYVMQKQRKFEEQLALHLANTEERTRLQEAIGRKSAWAARSSTGGKMRDKDKMARGARKDRAKGVAKSMKAMEKRLDQLGTVQRPSEKDQLNISIDPSEVSTSSHALTLSDVEVKLGDFHLGPVDLALKAGERMAILGRNGCGKTTLLKAAIGLLQPSSGFVRMSPNQRSGYFDQEHLQLRDELTVEGAIRKLIDLPMSEARNLLKRYGVGTEFVGRSIGGLSPGERARFLLASFAANRYTLLALDEPTNHLDVEAAEQLELALAEYNGTLIVISHDLTFLQNIGIDRFVKIEDGALQEVVDLDKYVRQLESVARKYRYHAPQGK